MERDGFMGEPAKPGDGNVEDARAWLKIGEAESREALRKAARKIQGKWAGRYDFRICKSAKGYELRLRHRG